MRTLFDTPTDEIEARFEDFHAAHPEVYREFRRIAHVLRYQRGYGHYSADGIMHVVRFHTGANADRDGGFKVNNNFVALYARLLARNEPAFASFFNFRRRKEAA
jgi:hypothetical protein